MLRSVLLPLVAAALAISQPLPAQDTAAPAAGTSHAAPTHRRPVPRVGDRSCLRSTGSLILPKAGECLPVPGRSYSQEEIRRTGSPTAGVALQQLDPSVTVRGH